MVVRAGMFSASGRYFARPPPARGKRAELGLKMADSASLLQTRDSLLPFDKLRQL
jgi:hypothetical protein